MMNIGAKALESYRLNKSIKGIAKIFLAAILFLSISSCEKRGCKDVVCAIGQACNNGKCYCADGYEGTDCQTLSFQKYLSLNSFTSESCNSIPPFANTNNVYFTADGSYINLIHIHNLMGGNCFDVQAYIRTDTNNEGNFLEIPEQQCGGSSVSGTGTYDKLNRLVRLDLYYYAGGTPYSCTTTVR